MDANDVTQQLEFPLSDIMEITDRQLLAAKNSNDFELEKMYEELQKNLVAAQNEIVNIQVKLTRRKIQNNINDQN